MASRKANYQRKMANADRETTETAPFPLTRHMCWRHSKTHKPWALGFLSCPIITKIVFPFLSRACILYSKTLFPETQIYQGPDNWGLAEGLMFQTEEK